jgi:hypothetical protein
LKTPIDSAVRAVGRIVVWVEAEAEVRIESRQQDQARLAQRGVAEQVGPDGGEHIVALSGLPSPTPSSPTPGEGDRSDGDQRVGRQQQERRDHAARPGVLPGSSLSSLHVTAVSQPQ